MLNPLMHHLRIIGGITRLSLRAAVRTKTVAALLVLLALCVGLLPGAIKGDGTAAGDLNILLMYTLGFAFGILCLATLWAACALFSAEIDSSRIHLSAVKPVPTLSFWLGKWLALLILNAFLLMVVYLGVYAQIAWRMHHSWESTDWPTTQWVTRPTLPSPEEEALAEYRILEQNHARPKGLSKAKILQVLAEKADEKYTVLNPGEEMHWHFRLIKPINLAAPVTVRIRFDSEYSTREQVTGLCKLWVSGYPSQAVEVPLDDFTLNELEFTVDSRAFSTLINSSKGLRDFEVSFRHTGQFKRVSALMLRFRKDVMLLTPSGSFEANLARAAGAQWCVLALLASFGLTLSACFSLPVATFVATLLLVLSLLGNSVVRVVSTEDEELWRNRVGIWVSRGVASVTREAIQTQPLMHVTHGERLTTASLLYAALWNVLVWPTFFAACGCFILRRRELADPA